MAKTKTSINPKAIALAKSLVQNVPIWDMDTKELIGHRELRGRITLYDLSLVKVSGTEAQIEKAITPILAKGRSVVPHNSNQSYTYFIEGTNHPTRIVKADLLFAKDYTVGIDPARELILGSRAPSGIPMEDAVVDFVTCKVVDYDADGHTYFPKGGRIHKLRNSLNSFQITGYELNGDEIEKTGTILKGMAAVDDGHIIPKQELEPDVDLYINKNVIKLGAFPVGSKVRYLLLQQNKSLETKTSKSMWKPMKLTWQSVFRLADIMVEKEFQSILDQIQNVMGLTLAGDLSSGHSAYTRAFGLEGIETNDLMGVAEELYRHNLPIAVQTTDRIITTILKNGITIKDMAYRVYAITDPNMKGLTVKVNWAMKDEYPIGSYLEPIRYPTNASEWLRRLTVIGYTDKGIEVSQDVMDMATGDTDGDFFTILKNKYIDTKKYDERWETMHKFYGGLVEDNIGSKDMQITALTATFRAILSSNQVAKADNVLTTMYFDSNLKITPSVLKAIKNAQAWLDFPKKKSDAELIYNTGRPAIYDIVGKKYESIKEFNELLIQAYVDLGSYEGRLHTLVKALLKAIPMVIIPSQSKISKGRSYTWYEEAWIKVNAENPSDKSSLTNDLRPEYLCGPAIDRVKAMSLSYFNSHTHLYKYAALLVKKYKVLVKALAFAKTDLEILKAKENMNQFNIDLEEASNPIVQETMEYIAKNILCGNPMKLIGSEKALFNIPLMKHNEEFFTKWQELTRYKPNYFVSTLYIKFED